MEIFKSKYQTISLMDNKLVIEQIYHAETESMEENDLKSDLVQLKNGFEKYKPKYVYADVSNLRFVIDPELQEWIAKNIIIHFSLNGGKKVAIRVSTEMINQLSFEQTIEEDKEAQYQTKYFDNKEEALKWLLS